MFRLCTITGHKASNVDGILKPHTSSQTTIVTREAVVFSPQIPGSGFALRSPAHAREHPRSAAQVPAHSQLRAQRHWSGRRIRTRYAGTLAGRASTGCSLRLRVARRDRSRRNGNRLPSSRFEPWPRCRHQDSPVEVLRDFTRRAAVRRRSAHHRATPAPRHPADPRSRHSRGRPAVPRDEAHQGPDACCRFLPMDR